jgi:very-short-patch-repair endonuclease
LARGVYPPLAAPRATRGKEGHIAKTFNRAEQKMTRKALRSNMPLSEVILWTKLKNKQLGGYKFRRQYSIECYVTDFYCPELKLAIEIDGGSHFEENAVVSDRERQARIESFGIRFERFTNRDVCENIEGVLLKIMERIQEITSPPPPCKGGD